MRLALLSNVTVEVLAGMLKKEHALWLPSGYGAWMETALEPPPGLKAFNPEAIFLLLDTSHAVVDEEYVPKAKELLEAAFPAATVIVPDLEDLADETGDFHDERMWKIGSMPWSMKGLNAIKDEIARLLRAMKSERKKVLAVDFDNTLWDGVIGEDGVQDIKPFEEFQRGIKALVERGIVLVGLTKNNVEDVEPVWSDARMALKKEDFAAMRINWRDKAENLRDIARELNLGVDSFVFVDDNPAEREQMKARLPEVATVSYFPHDPQDLPRFLRRIERLYFPSMRLTEEDRRKTAQYREESARRNFAEGLSAEEYLKGLRMWAEIHRAREDEFVRIAQLSQKTNQFNVLTNRYTVGDIAGFASDPSRVLLSVRAGDKFGEQGLVAFVQAITSGDSATIVDWVMSCRVMNRRLEFAVEWEMEKILVDAGVRTVSASWRRSKKNAPVENLFESLGFPVLEGGENEKSYALSLPRANSLEHCIEIKGE